ncbi:hypothetical protein PIB30_064676, partial [Stylosanthes scabra]|nr:hypothetical protein [Stylosanthes scabra]
GHTLTPYYPKHKTLQTTRRSSTRAPYKLHRKLHCRLTASSIVHSRRYLCPKLCRAYPSQDSLPSFVVTISIVLIIKWIAWIVLLRVEEN